MKIQAIIPSAGLGERLGACCGKPFVELKNKPLIVHTLEVFERCSLIDKVILVGNPDRLSDLEKLVSEYELSKVRAVVAGGAARKDSVNHAIQAVDEDTDIVVIHDGARPFVTAQLIERLLDACDQQTSVVAAVPVKPTIKRVDSQTQEVIETLKRSELWDIQTPQVFARDVIVRAYQQGADLDVTDDASLVEHLGFKVKVVEGDQQNIKITTPQDLVLAEQLLTLKQEG